MSISTDFHSNSKEDAPFHQTAHGHSLVVWDGLCGHLKDVPQDDISELGVSATTTELCDWVQGGIDV